MCFSIVSHLLKYLDSAAESKKNSHYFLTLKNKSFKIQYKIKQKKLFQLLQTYNSTYMVTYNAFLYNFYQEPLL